MKDISKRYLSIFLQVVVVIAVIFAVHYDSKDHDDSVPGATLLHEIKVSHGFDLCDLPLLVAQKNKLSEQFQTEIKLVRVAEKDRASSVVAGRLQAAVVPFTAAIRAYAEGKSIRIIAGCGMDNLDLVGQLEIQNKAALRNKTLGTLQTKNMEVFADDAVNGLKQLNVHIKYYDDEIALLNAFDRRSIQSMTNVESYATLEVKKRRATILASSSDVWGLSYPACVLIASETGIISDHNALKGLIGGMLKAQSVIRSDPQAAKEVANLYFDPHEFGAGQALPTEPPQIDIREAVHFIVDRSNSLQRMGQISEAVDRGIFDLKLLKEFAKEQPELFVNGGVEVDPK